MTLPAPPLSVFATDLITPTATVCPGNVSIASEQQGQLSFLTHVSDRETAERRVVSESLDTHGLGWDHLDDGSVPGLDKLGGVFDRLSGATVDLLEDLGELAGNVGGVAVEDWSVAGTNLAGVVEDDDLGVERVGAFRRVVLGVTGDVATADFLDGHVLDVETNVVARETLDELLVVHLDGLDFGGDVGRSKGHDHASLDDTGLNTADGYGANTANLVDVLKGETEGLVGRTGRRVDGIDGFQKGLAGSLGLGLLLPALVPWAVAGVVDHVVAVETGDGDKGDGLGVVANLLDEVGRLLDNLVVTVLGPLGSVHLVDGDDELLDTQGVCKQSVLTRLAILGDTGFEFTSTSGNNEDGAISLGSTSDHVLDKVAVARSVWNLC